jgi:hypothetical protein
VKHPAQMHKRDRIQHAATQRMSSPGYTYRAGQHPAEMLQSVAYLVGAGKTHLATAHGHIASAATAPSTWPAPTSCSSA